MHTCSQSRIYKEYAAEVLNLAIIYCEGNRDGGQLEPLIVFVHSHFWKIQFTTFSQAFLHLNFTTAG